MFQLFQRPTCPLLRDSSDQKSMCILKNNGVDYETQKQEATKNHQDSHNYTINQVCTIVTDQITYSRCMRKLKRLRKKSDYENADIVPVEATSAYGWMQDVLSILVP